MNQDNSKELLDYPFRSPSALEPPTEWAQLRDKCPVAHVRLPSGDSAVLLTRHSDVRQLLSDPRFSHNLSAEGAARTTANEEGSVFESKDAALLADSERHQGWRRMIMKWSTAKRIAAMQQRIESMAESLIDSMVKQGGPADLTAHLGYPLPVWVICDVLGIPDVDRDKLAYWSNTMLSMTQYSQAEINAAQQEFTQYLLSHIEEKRKNPGDDLLSELSAAAGPGQSVPAELLLMTAKGLLVAGHETTSNMIGKMMGMLLSVPSRWQQLLSDPSLVRTAVEESLRFDANPGFGLPRYVSVDTEVGGTLIPRGTTVICSMGAANRDERAYEQSDEMHLERNPNPHLSFGAGPHSCIGQALARTELQTVLSVLLRRLPTLALAVPVDELSARHGLLIGGLERLMVRW